MSAITYSWNFNPLEIVYNEEGMTDVINVVHWQYTAAFALETGSIQQTSIGTVSLPTPAVGSFIPFADVTKEMVTEWVVTAMGSGSVETMQNSLSSSLAQQLNPTTGLVTPPWT